MQVYLDFSATTPMAPEVNEAMYAWNREQFGNPSSIHRFGQASKVKLEACREQLAAHLNGLPKEIVFTSGGTESNNLALIGAAQAFRERGKHIIASAVEHPSVLESLKHLSDVGFEITYAYPDKDGRIGVSQIEPLFRDDTILVSLMMVNNETGIIHDVPSVAESCRAHNALLHVDAVQALGKVSFDLTKLPVHLLSVSGHKVYGPKGVGALFIRQGTPMERRHYGGGQEANRRGGTENLSGIVGFAKALELLERKSNDTEHARALQKHFENELKVRLPFIEIIGRDAPRSPFISKISFPGTNNEMMLLNLDMAGVAASVGSACSSGSIKPSHVLEAMHLPDVTMNSALRFSYGRYTSFDQMNFAIDKITEIAERLRTSNKALHES